MLYLYLVLGDKKGYIKILNLKGVFGKYKNVLNRPQNYHVTGSNFNLLKKIQMIIKILINLLMMEKKKNLIQENCLGKVLNLNQKKKD